MRFQTGGTLKPDAIYIERSADRELYEVLCRGEFCYVLAPRQIGKSSLRARTAQRLKSAGVHCVSIDLTSIGTSGIQPADWYFSLAYQLSRELKLSIDLTTFWVERKESSLVQSWASFLRDVVLPAIPGEVVILIDEIDAVRSLPFPTEDFFAFLRYVHNARAEDPGFQRLTVALVGVAAPADLIADTKLTPFNVGRSIRLEDFTADEARGFLPGLVGCQWEPQRLLDAVLYWTGGHPYMTQRLCAALAEERTLAERADTPEQDVERLVQRLFLKAGRTEDSNLMDAQRRMRRLTLGKPDSRVHRMLQLYKRLLFEEMAPANPNDPVQLDLRLAGMACERLAGSHRWLCVRNRIFAAVFDLDWVREHDTDTLLAQTTERWLISGRKSHYLIRGQALSDLLQAVQGRSDASSEEYAFLTASQAGERKARTRANTILAALIVVMTGFTASLAYNGRLSLEARTSATSLAAAGLRLQQLTAAGDAARREALAAHRQASSSLSQMRLASSEAATLKQLAENTRRQVSGLHSQMNWLQQQSRQAVQDAASARLLQARAAASARAAALAAAASRQSELQALGQTREAASSRQEALQEAARAQQIKDGALASALAQRPGGEMDALEAGVRAVLPALRCGAAPPTVAFQGLVDAVTCGHWQTRQFQWAHALYDATYSPDSSWVMTASDDRTVQIWDASTGRLVRVLHAPAAVSTARFSPDGTKVVAALANGTIRLFDPITGMLLPPVIAVEHPPVSRDWWYPAGVSSATFSPDGRYVVSPVSGGWAQVWDTITGQPAGPKLGANGVRIRTATFSNDGQQVLLAPDRDTASLWDWRSGKRLLSIPSRQLFYDTRFSHDGRFILTAQRGGGLGVWNSSTGANLVSAGYGGDLWCICSVQDGALMATGCLDGEVDLWDESSGGQLARVTSCTAAIRSLDASADGSSVLLASENGSAEQWLVRSPRPLLELYGHRYRITAGFFTAGGRRILTVSQDQTARISDAATGKLIRTVQIPLRIEAADVSPNGRWFAIGCQDGRILVFDESTGKLMTTLPAFHSEVVCARFSPDSQWLVSASADGACRMDRSDGSGAGILLGPRPRGASPPITSAAFSPDGRRVVSAGADGALRVWDAASGQQLKLLYPPGEPRRWDLEFSPDGTRLLTLGDDGSCRTWDWPTGKELPPVIRSTGARYLSACFSPDGASIATSDSNGVVQLWDAADGRLLLSFPRRSAPSWSVRFSPDGRRIVATCGDGVARVYPTHVEDYVHAALRILALLPPGERKGRLASLGMVSD